jgi:peptidoglycan/xylan/chitin deacetylase (PgdA/CDA1 family)
MTAWSKAPAIPVLMLHSVAPPEQLAPFDWLKRLTTPPDLLEASLAAWQRNGTTTLGMDEVDAILDGAKPVRRGAIAITLDDGYLDNWVVLDPLLRKYGHRATVFISTDFADPTVGARPRLGEAPERGGIQWKGYLNWDEMRQLERDGTIDIQSHAKTHTWYFVSDRIVDYYRPANSLTKSESMLRFLWLNSHPDDKPFSLDLMTESSIPWGTPIYEYRPALVARRFHPDPDEAARLVELVAQHGGAAFFERADWRGALDAEVERQRSRGRSTGTLESDDEYRARVRGELVESRRILSERLNKDVRFLAFPQGAHDAAVEDIAREAGYKRWTVASWRYKRLNRPGESTHRVYRCGTGLDLFGADARPWMRLQGQRVVLRRFAGSRAAHVVTGMVSMARRLLEAAG